MWSYPVLDPVSQAYPEVQGRSPTCYSPVRHSSTSASTGLSVRLACVKHAASVHPEPGSNSPQKMFQQKQAVKSPIPNQKQTNQHPNRRRTGKNPKITRFNNRPQPDGAKQGRSKYVKHVQPHPTHTMNQKMTRSIIGIQPRHHRHTPKHRAHTTQCTKRSRQTHPRNKSTLAHYRVLKQHQHTQHQPTQVSQHQSDFGIYQRLFSCPPHKPERISPSSGALSVSLTRYKLHTPHSQHKPAAKRGF